MKLFSIPCILSACLLATGLLVGCQNDQMVTPTQTDNKENNQNAKTSAELILVKDGGDSLEYVKSGKFAGRLARTSNSTQFTEYTYNDGSGDLWITSKTHSKKSNILPGEKTYHTVNGRCVESKDLTSKSSQQYKYNALGSLVEIKSMYAGITTTIQYSYKAIAPPNTARLDKITYIGANGPFIKYTFNYSAKVDKYFLNPEHTHLDKYLNIFGKFSDLLVQDVTTEYLDPDPAYQYVSFDVYAYILNIDGYVTSRTREYYPHKYEPDVEVKTDILKYTNGWQVL